MRVNVNLRAVSLATRTVLDWLRRRRRPVYHSEPGGYYHRAGDPPSDEELAERRRNWEPAVRCPRCHPPR